MQDISSQLNAIFSHVLRRANDMADGLLPRKKFFDSIRKTLFLLDGSTTRNSRRRKKYKTKFKVRYTFSPGGS